MDLERNQIEFLETSSKLNGQVKELSGYKWRENYWSLRNSEEIACNSVLRDRGGKWVDQTHFSMRKFTITDFCELPERGNRVGELLSKDTIVDSFPS